MKKLFITFFMVFSLQLYAFNPIPNFCQIVPLQLSIVKGGSLSNPIPRSPMEVPEVGYYDHTLYFGQEFEDNIVVTLEDDNEVEVLSTYLYAGQTQLSLPASLSGDYTLYIYKGNFAFVGEITLD